jgi:hypothetical protein
MTWGQGAQPVPSLDGGALVLLALMLLVLGASVRFRATRIAPLVILLLVPLVALGVPHVFQNGTIADADQVNENFSDLENSQPNLAFSSEVGISRFNTSGTTSASLGPTTDRICFLIGVRIGDIYTNNEAAECHVVESGGEWQLNATLVGNNDADVSCWARCLTW